MVRLCSFRWLVAVGFVVAGVAGSLIGAERSSSAMAGAASKFLASLTPEQRQKAAFAFTNADERLHWHFIPTGPPPMFPRNGLTIKEMSQAQRTLAHDLIKAG